MIGPGHRVDTKTLFEEWRGWCDLQGITRPGTAPSFGRDLHAAAPGIAIRQGTKERFYEGITLTRLATHQRTNANQRDEALCSESSDGAGTSDPDEPPDGRNRNGNPRAGSRWRLPAYHDRSTPEYAALKRNVNRRVAEAEAERRRAEMEERTDQAGKSQAKDHGEGGSIVGAPLQGRILVVDDVITAGTAIREVASIIQTEGAELAGVMVGLDRQERGAGELSAIQEVEKDYSIPVLSIVQLAHILAFLEDQPAQQTILQRMQAYRAQYGIVTVGV